MDFGDMTFATIVSVEFAAALVVNCSYVGVVTHRYVGGITVSL